MAEKSIVQKYKKDFKELFDSGKLKIPFGDHKKFYKAMDEFDQIIEMDEVKKEFLSILITYAFQFMKTGKAQFNGRKFHYVLMGPSGCGKTTIARVFCKLLTSLGFLQGKRQRSGASAFNGVIKVQDELLHQNQIQITALNDTISQMRHTIKDVSDALTRTKAMRASLYTHKDKIPNSNRYIQDCGYISSVLEKTMLNLDKKPEIERHKSMFSFNLTGGEDKSSNIKKDDDLPFYTLDKKDLVGEYVGHTSKKASDALRATIGGCVFIDECYALVSPRYSGGNSYEKDALVELIKFMEDFEDNVSVILAGYETETRALLDDQEGLSRRIAKVFTITGYSPNGLAKIYLKQIKKQGYTADKEALDYLEKVIKDNPSQFKNFGGDTEAVCNSSIDSYTERHRNDMLKGILPEGTPLISKFDIENAMKSKEKHKFKKNDNSLNKFPFV